MRKLILIGFFACLFLHFQSKDEVVSYDVLSTGQSSIKKIEPTTTSMAVSDAVTLVTEEMPSVSVLPSEDTGIIAEAEIEDDEEEDEGDDVSQLPWDDIEEGWKTNLKEYLTSVDPTKADDMFAAYLEEKKKYIEKVDFGDSEETTESSSSEEPLIENDVKVGEIERIHTDNLKEIFGDHYSKIESLHKEYVESVQYLNRSSVKFTISL